MKFEGFRRLAFGLGVFLIWVSGCAALTGDSGPRPVDVQAAYARGNALLMGSSPVYLYEVDEKKGPRNLGYPLFENVYNDEGKENFLVEVTPGYHVLVVGYRELSPEHKRMKIIYTPESDTLLLEAKAGHTYKIICTKERDRQVRYNIIESQ